MGVVDTGGNVLLLSMWGESVGPIMQGLHAAFGVGAFLGPLLAKPFLGRSLTLPARCAIEATCNNSASDVVFATSTTEAPMR